LTKTLFLYSAKSFVGVPKTKQKWAVTVLLLSILFILAGFPEQTVHAQSETIVVPDSYASIQEAVDAASDGDTVYVKRGTYQGSVFVNKSISLIGQDRETTVIKADATVSDTAVLIRHDNVNMTGFTVIPAGGTIYARGVHLLHVSHCNFSGNIVKLTGYRQAVWLYGSSENIISGNIVSDNYYGITIQNSHGNNVSGNVVEKNDYGIILKGSQNNILSENRVSKNGWVGIKIEANNNTIESNVVKNHEEGILLLGNENTLRNNTIADNVFNFRVGTSHQSGASYLVNDVDQSNMVNGKPIIYWINVQNEQVPSDAGYVALFNCTNIVMQNMSLSKNEHGILMVNTTNSLITKNRFSDYHKGVFMFRSDGNQIIENSFINSVWHAVAVTLVASSNNTAYRNTISTSIRADSNAPQSGFTLSMSSSNVICENVMDGASETSNGMVLLHYSLDNNISRNVIDAHYTGIYIKNGTEGNRITENTISNNNYGLLFVSSWSDSLTNRFYRNNFVDNSMQMYDLRDRYPLSFWDDGFEGNYWSDYTGTDRNGDGIGDTPHYTVDGGQDSHPLIAPLVWFDAGKWEWIQCYVDIVSRSSVSNFSFSPTEKLIRFTVSGAYGALGSCRVIIPKAMLDSETGWNVLVDGEYTNCSVKEDNVATRLSFRCEGGTQTVEIIGTTAVPEFPSWIILPLLITATVLVTLFRRKLSKTLRQQSH
jgi:parallel beta-helix repeat protein